MSIGSQRDLVQVQQHNHLDYTPSVQLTSQASIVSPRLNAFGALDSDRCNIREDAQALEVHERPRAQQHTQSQLEFSSIESQGHMMSDELGEHAPPDDETIGSRAAPNTSEYSAMQQKLRSRAGSFAKLANYVNIWDRDVKALFLKLFEFHGVQVTRLPDLHLIHRIRLNFFERDQTFGSLDFLCPSEADSERNQRSGPLSFREFDQRRNSDMLVLQRSVVKKATGLVPSTRNQDQQ